MPLSETIRVLQSDVKNHPCHCEPPTLPGGNVRRGPPALGFNVFCCGIDSVSRLFRASPCEVFLAGRRKHSPTQTASLRSGARLPSTPPSTHHPCHSWRGSAVQSAPGAFHRDEKNPRPGC